MKPPAAPRDDHEDDYHGTRVADPYRWLERPDSERTGAFVGDQNAASERFVAAVAGRERLRDVLTNGYDSPRLWSPLRAGGWLYLIHNPGLQAQASLVRCRDLRLGSDPELELVLDPNTWSEDGTTSLRGWSVSLDGRWLAYGASEAGSDWIAWRVRDLTEGRDLPETIRHSKFPVAAWLPDSRSFLYLRLPEPDDRVGPTLGTRMMLHRVGTDAERDVRVYERPDQPQWTLVPQVSDDGTLLVVTVAHGTDERMGIHVQALDRVDDHVVPVGSMRTLVDPGVAQHGFITKIGQELVVLTDRDAPNRRVVAIDLDRPDPEHWRLIVAQTDDPIVQCTAVGGQLFVVRLHHASARVTRVDPETAAATPIPLPGLGTVLGFQGRRQDHETWFEFTAFGTPPKLLAVDTASGDVRVGWQPAGDAPSAHTQQHFVTSPDGTRVPVFVTFVGQLDAPRPTLLYGYGGFGNPLTPRYDPTLQPWLSVGGVYVVANTRGGGEYGADWHDAGTKHQKQNVFDDFIAVAEWLVTRGITTRAQLGIHGRSNGGLLVGAVLVQRPELFAAVVPGFGVLDMLRYQHFTIGWAWARDYGTSDDPEMFETLYAYSPVHNARAAEYPATLVMTADHDDRVVPAHSYKFAAALQHAQRGSAPILLRVDTRSGHGLGRSVTQVVDEKTDMIAFLAATLGADLTAL